MITHVTGVDRIRTMSSHYSTIIFCKHSPSLIANLVNRETQYIAKEFSRFFKVWHCQNINSSLDFHV